MHKIQFAIQEKFEPAVLSKTDCRIKVFESKKPKTIEKDKKFPYASIILNKSRVYAGWDYFRYGTHIRTIWKKTKGSYITASYTCGDENAVLKCIRNHLYETLYQNSGVLIHGSLVELHNKGIFIVGACRTGKTSLAVTFLQNQGSIFISDENTFLSYDGYLQGSYVPRAIRARFATIAQSKLSKVLCNTERSEATQYIDEDALVRIIKTRAFHVDAGLAFSRRAFARLLDVQSKATSQIHIILFPVFLKNQQFWIKQLQQDDLKDRLQKTCLSKKEEMSLEELSPRMISIPNNWLSGTVAFEVGFNNFEQALQADLFKRIQQLYLDMNMLNKHIY